MSIEDYKRHLDAQALQSDGKLSPSRELLEQLIDMVFRLDREVYHGVGAGIIVLATLVVIGMVTILMAQLVHQVR